MRNLIVVTGLTLYTGLLLAQAGGHIGGGSMGGGRSAGRIVSAAPSRSGAAAGRSLSVRPLNQGSSGGSWTSAGFVPNHSGYGNGYAPGSRRNRVGYAYPGLLGYPFAYYPGYYGGLGFDDNDGNDPNQQGNAVASGYSDNGNGYAGDPQGYPGPVVPPNGYDYPPDPARPAYDGSGPALRSTQTATADSDGLEHPKVTLVFKDGHTLQIQNYAATRTKIFVRDAGAERDIPVSSLDVAATQTANDNAGVEFSLPAGQ